MAASINITPAQLAEFRATGVLVVEDVFSADEVEHAREAFHQHLATLGIDHAAVLAGTTTVADGPRIKSPIGRIFYPSWKLRDIHLDPRVVGLASDLLLRTYGSGKDPDFAHPFGAFDAVRAYVDRICWRLPDVVRAEGGLFPPSPRLVGIELNPGPFTWHCNCGQSVTTVKCPGCDTDAPQEWLAKKKATLQKYRKSEKGKANETKQMAAFSSSGRKKKAAQKYHASEKGKSTTRAYATSEKGKQVRRKAVKKYLADMKAVRKQLLYDLSNGGKCVICDKADACDIDHMMPPKKIRGISQCRSMTRLIEELEANTVDGILLLRGVCEPCHAQIDEAGRDRSVAAKMKRGVKKRAQWCNAEKRRIRRCQFPEYKHPDDICEDGTEYLFHMDHLHPKECDCAECTAKPDLRKKHNVSWIVWHGDCHLQHTNNQTAAGIINKRSRITPTSAEPASSPRKPQQSSAKKRIRITEMAATAVLLPREKITQKRSLTDFPTDAEPAKKRKLTSSSSSASSDDDSSSSDSSDASDSASSESSSDSEEDEQML